MYATKAKQVQLISSGVTLMYNLSFLMQAGVPESKRSFKAANSLASWDRFLFHNTGQRVELPTASLEKCFTMPV